MAQLIEVGSGPVNETERRTVEILLDGLPPYYRVVPNVTLADQPSGQAFEYDAIVLAGHAVYAVEVKGWGGTIRAVNRRDWQLESGHYAANPLPLIDFKARVLKSHLKELELEAPGGAVIAAPFVMGCFVCGADDAVLEVFAEDRHRCLRPGELCAFIEDHHQLPTSTERDRYKPVMKKLAGFLEGRLQGRDPAPRRFAGFRVIQTVAQREDSAEYLAAHAEFDDGRVYRVRTWWVSPYRFEPVERERRLKVLRRSAEALHLIGSHPNVVSLHAFDAEADCIFEVTEWSTVGTLATALSLGSPRKWTVERKISLLLGIARALAAAHAKDIFHRDLRPGAILLGADGQPRVGDFDLAYVVSADETVYGEAALKVIADHHYRPPELRDLATADVHDSTDLYSLGRIAFDVFAGKQPGGPGGRDLPLLSTTCEPGEIPDSIVEDLDLLVSSMVEADPGDRPGSPAVVVEMLEEMLTTLAKPVRAAQAPRAVEHDVRALDHFEPGERIDDCNMVIEVLGRGAWSTVYLVHNDVLQDQLALKLVHGEGDRTGPVRDLKLLMKVRHPNLVKAFWAGQLPGRGDVPGPAYLLMERLSGGTLAARIGEAEGGKLGVDLALEIVRGLAAALAALHGASPPHVHRDVKPENVHLTDRGPVLADVGTAAPVAEAGNVPVGSPRYTPPDLATAGWGPDADVFALGTVAWHMLTGGFPWGAGEPSTDVPRTALARDGLSPEVAEVVTKAVAPFKKDRFADAGELIDALERAVSSRAEQEPRPVSDPALPPVRSRSSPWDQRLVRALCERTSASRVLYSVLRRGTANMTSVLEAEAFAMALEEPLADAMPSVYDELLTPSAAWPVLSEGDLAASEADDEPDAITPVFNQRTGLLVLDGLSPFEVQRMIDAAVELGRTVDEWVWRAGPIDPAAPGEGTEALAHLLGAAPGLHDCTSVDALVHELGTGRRRVRLRLDEGRRDDDLSALLARRWAVIERVLIEAAATIGDVWVTSTHGVVYLGHGLRLDVGSSAAHRADRIRTAWRAACPAGRIGRLAEEVEPLEGPVRGPCRRSGERVFPVGRLAWPDTPDAPRLASGGLSLPERLLPLVRLRRP
jgi:serine/threonine protein kinase